jgi:hypothetical protein
MEQYFACLSPSSSVLIDRIYCGPVVLRAFKEALPLHDTDLQIHSFATGSGKRGRVLCMLIWICIGSKEPIAECYRVLRIRGAGQYS